MATDDHIITNGPSKWNLMLALFDNEDCQRLLSFTAESERHRELEAKRNVSGGYDGLTREEEIEVEVYDLNIGPYEMKVLVLSVTVDGSEKWKISGIDMENHHDVTIQYSTKTRKGKCEIGRAYLDPKDNQDVDFAYHHRQVDMPPWTCDWCKKSFSEDDDQPRETHDGESICSECWERDDEGPQIARYGSAAYEAEDEPERVVDADGKVDYE